MPLQSDPTVIYGIKNFNGNLTKEDLLRPTPYNTYLLSGLPPTPSAIPGKIPFSQPSTRLLSPIFISFPRMTGPTIFLLKSKNIIGRSGNIKNIEEKNNLTKK